MIGNKELIPIEDKMIVISLDDYEDDKDITVEMEPVANKSTVSHTCCAAAERTQA